MTQFGITSVGHLQDHNLRRVLEAIMSGDGMTRQDLVETTGFSPAGISKLVGILIDKELVQEHNLVSRRRGRRAISLRINENCMYSLGVRFARNYVKVGIFNVMGRLLSSNYRSIEEQDLETTIETITDQIDDQMQAMDDEMRAKLMGIGISAPGPLFGTDGRIALISNAPGWRNVALAECIQERFGKPTFMEHDANVSALAEYWYGQGRNVRRLVYVVADRGVGAGFMLDGAIYGGMNNIAGEIGHTTIQFNGPKCDCGNYGCLEMYCSSLAFLRKAKWIAKEERPAGWPGPHRLTTDQVFELAVDGEPVAKHLVEESGRFLGIGVVNLINAFNPDMIVLGDEMARAGELLLQSVHSVVRERVIPEIAEETRIVLSQIIPEPAFAGTGSLVVKRVFESLSQVEDGPLVVSRTQV